MNPGSNHAKILGCNCPIFSNNFGTGMYHAECPGNNAVYLVNSSCLIHGVSRWHVHHIASPANIKFTVVEDHIPNFTLSQTNEKNK